MATPARGSDCDAIASPIPTAAMSYWKPGGGPTQHRGDRRGGGGAIEKAAREKNAQIPPLVGGWGSESEAGAGRAAHTVAA